MKYALIVIFHLSCFNSSKLFKYRFIYAFRVYISTLCIVFINNPNTLPSLCDSRGSPIWVCIRIIHSWTKVLRVCISKNFPCDTDTAGLRPHVENQLLCFYCIIKRLRSDFIFIFWFFFILTFLYDLNM